MPDLLFAGASSLLSRRTGRDLLHAMQYYAIEQANIYHYITTG
jgi:hypothetical protein